MENAIELLPIGFVEENTWQGVDIRDLPSQERRPKRPEFEGWIRIDPTYQDGLQGVENCQELLILFWFDQLQSQERGILQAHPGGDHSRPPQGVFSLRSPLRPNPIGVTTVKLLERKGNRLRVRGLDAYPGSPVLDIKVALKPQ